MSGVTITVQNGDQSIEITSAELDLIENVLYAARDVVREQGKPGAAQRRARLDEALSAHIADEPITAVMIAAALWNDRYGSSGAPERLNALRAAVDRIEVFPPQPEDS